MYVTYETPQWRVDHLRGELSRPVYTYLPHRRFISLPSADVKPKWLVRVCDMALVRGTQVDQEFCVLSYAQSQSGDIVNGQRIDHGNHTIVSSGGKGVAATMRQVPFQGIVQQICKDFNVNYIWYDKMCMEHPDVEQVRSAYSHAYYTIVLIPEFRVDQKGSFPDIGEFERSEWWKDAASMKQATMSKRLLFVGSNVHMWWYTMAFSNMWAVKYERIFLSIFSTMVKPSPAPSAVFQRPCMSSKYAIAKMNASKVLWQVHGHKSPHDKVFALANMYPDIMGEIDHSYEQPLTNLMTPLYNLFARMDISILFFGRSSSDQEESTRQESNLFPSWAGFGGVHVPQLPMSNKPIRTMFNKYKMDGKHMHLRSVGVPVSIPTDTPDEAEVSALDDIYDDEEEWSNPKKVTLSETPGSLAFASIPDEGLWRVTDLYGLRATHWLPIRKEAEGWVNTLSSPNYASGYLSLTEKCTECIILSDIAFYTDSTNIRAYPVVRKVDPTYHEAIGLCFSFNLRLLGSTATNEEIVVQ